MSGPDNWDRNTSDGLRERTLRELLSQQPLRLSEVRRVGSQIADALARGHAQGAPHGGVSPSTVRVGTDGRARLAASSGRPLEDAYVSPEYVKGEPIGPAADVYALGLVLLEAISGRQVYPGSGRAAAEARLAAPPLVPNDVPGPMARALLAMTETVPGARPTAARAAAMLAAEPTGGAVERPVAATGPSVGKIAAIGLPFLVLLVLLGVALWGSGSADTTGGVSPDSTTSATATPTRSATRTAVPTGTPTPTKTSTSDKPTHPTSPETPGFTMPSLPTTLPDLPDKPEIPSSVTDKAESLWTDFKDWLGKLFG